MCGYEYVEAYRPHKERGRKETEGERERERERKNITHMLVEDGADETVLCG